MTNGDVLRVGVIGAGGHASGKIYGSLNSLPVRLVAVCDLEESKARRNAGIFGGQVYTDHQIMLREAELDAVFVCVGGDGHAKLAIDVMEAGLPVYTEKPPAASAADAGVMLEVSRRTGQICMTGFMKRFAPLYQKAKQAVTSDEFGAPSLLAIDWSFGVPDQAWLDMFLVDFGVHMIDLSRYLFGEVGEVYAREKDRVSYAVTLGFVNGAVGTLAMTANRGYHVVENIELAGDFGNYVSTDSSGRLIRYGGGEVTAFHERPLAMQDSLSDAGYRGELVEFLSAIEEGREPESSIASSYQTMRLYEAITRSVAEGRPVRLEG